VLEDPGVGVRHGGELGVLNIDIPLFQDMLLFFLWPAELVQSLQICLLVERMILDTTTVLNFLL